MAEIKDYNGLLEGYYAVMDDVDLVGATRSIIYMTGESYSTANYKARALFHMKKDEARHLGALSASDVNTFEEDYEKKARDIVTEELNSYIRSIEMYPRYANKINSLYAYLIHSSLFGVLGNIYVPEELRPGLDACIEEISNKSEKILLETQEYFYAKGDEVLSSIIRSLGHFLLASRTDQVAKSIGSSLSTAHNEEGLTISQEDYTYLENQRFYYLRFSSGVNLSFIREKLGLADTTYNNNKNIVIKDLVTRVSDSSKELIKNLFLDK